MRLSEAPKDSFGIQFEKETRHESERRDDYEICVKNMQLCMVYAYKLWTQCGALFAFIPKFFLSYCSQFLFPYIFFYFKSRLIFLYQKFRNEIPIIFITI